jgi:adenylosuccinate synthase
MPGRLEVVVGGQFGSEAKGAVAAHLATERRNLMAVRVAGPNAGHTVVDSTGRTWKLQQVPVAAVTNPDATLVVAAGSEIELDLLMREEDELTDAGFNVRDRLFVDHSATMIEKHHSENDRALLTSRIGSTGKGVGSARAARVMREAELFGGPWNTAQMLNRHRAQGGDVLVEGTQGYGLGLHGEYYPQCTSSDCRAIDFLAMAGINPWLAETLAVWVVLRTFPIRVAGNSGPLKNELSWSDLGVEPETTTVTKKTRRVGEWDGELARAALTANGAPVNTRVALTFLDYLVPDLANKTGREVILSRKAREYVSTFEDELGHPIDLIGTGPSAYTCWRG